MRYLDLIRKQPKEEQDTSTVSGRASRPTSDQWLEAWCELAAMTEGVLKSDWRFNSVTDLLEECDRAFESGSWLDFQRLAGKVQALMDGEGKK